MVNFLMHALEIFGICFLRFRPVPRLWCMWLVAANCACLLFITHIEAQAVLAVTGVAVVVQTLIYQRIGFTRILGTAHILWIPMFAWIATRLDVILAEPELANWLLLLLITNLISLFVDMADAMRFLRGERSPHYRWNVARPA